VDTVGVCCNPGRFVPVRGRKHYIESVKEVPVMPILFAVLGTPLSCFAEGAILGASVYLVSRGVKNPLRSKKK